MEATRTEPGAGTEAGATASSARDDQDRRRRRWWPRWWAALIAIVLTATAVAMLVDPSLVRTAASSNATGSSNGATGLTTFGGGLAPPISLPDLVDPSRTLSLAGLRGRPVLVNFWASWCVPCRKEMPVLEAAYRRLHGRVVFLGVDTNDTRGAALSFLRQTGVTYASAYDPHGTAAAAYGLFGLPTTVFVAPSGRMIERHVGELSPSTLAASIHSLVGAASK